MKCLPKKPEKARMCLETWIKLVVHRELADDCGLCGRPSSRAQSRNAMPTATRYCVLKNVVKGPQCRGTENKQTCLDEHEGLDGKVIRFRISSEFLLSRCAELLAESVAIRLQPCGTWGPKSVFDEHASLDTSQSQAQRDSATLKATHDDSAATCRHCCGGSKGMRPIHQHRDPGFHLARISWSGTCGPHENSNTEV